MSRCRSINAISRFYNHAPQGMSFELEVQVEALFLKTGPL
jgi:hypothetical protein